MSPSFNAATISQRLDDGSIVLTLPDIRRSPLSATVLNLDDADFCRRRVFLMVPESRLRFKRTDLFFQLCPKNRTVKIDKIKASTPFLRLWGRVDVKKRPSIISPAVAWTSAPRVAVSTVKNAPYLLASVD